MSELMKNSEERIEAKIVIGRNALLNALEELKSVVSKKNTTIPITQSIHVRTGENKIIWSATNMSVSLRKITEDDIEVEGSAEFTIEPGLIYQTVNSITSNNEVIFEIGYSTIYMQVLRNQFQFPKGSANDFPLFPQLDEIETAINIPIPRLKEIVKNTRVALGDEAIENAFSGIKFHPIDDVIKIASTNKHKLYYLEERTSHLDATNDASEVVLPKHFIDFIMNVSGIEASIMYSSSRSSNHIKIEYDKNVAMIRKITGKYPDISFILKALGKEDYITIDFSKANLKKILSIATKYSDRGEAIFKIDNIESGIEIDAKSYLENASKLFLTSEGIDAGKLNERHEVVLNIKYLLEMISSPAASYFRFYFPYDKTKPIIFRPLYSEEEEIESLVDELFLVMPIMNLEYR